MTDPSNQDRYWTENWQEMEREALIEIESERLYRFANVEDAIKFLHKMAKEKKPKSSNIFKNLNSV